MNPADELRTAAAALRQARFPAAMTATASTAALIGARLPLADWLDATAATLDANTHPGWQETVAPHPLAVARAINGTP
ncbi:hypothetical protein ACI3K5_23875 [Streptomyces sp. MPA0124]|uniref:hypothetical protein n=1 Tax=Streptomyces sp. MPA0124 TaxID=3378069 RepID=UPI00385441A2